MNDLTDDIFAADLKSNVNLFRQNLQTEYVKAMTAIIAAPGGYDNASKAAALSTLLRIKGQLATATSTDEQTKAHRAALGFLIDKATAVNK